MALSISWEHRRSALYRARDGGGGQNNVLSIWRRIWTLNLHKAVWHNRIGFRWQIKCTEWAIEDLRFMFVQVEKHVLCVTVKRKLSYPAFLQAPRAGWSWTRRFCRMGCGHLTGWGPIHYKKKWKYIWVHEVCEWSSANISRAPRRLPALLYSKSALFKSRLWVRREEIAHTAAPAFHTRIPKQILFG